ncbi:hypothetical protein HNR62_000209 [Oceanisphaera litoralis]|uniref:DUF2817 domain-containing protein n=1 Tax=Oceanisphaera litoralis TaxID=225144 RepID=UPI00195BA126|nr:DUF2817 domain-containing protein [Oceanisphaera litoralis]MBM7454385.1 hypothetical protein [Oceanisphaera litoralis]
MALQLPYILPELNELARLAQDAGAYARLETLGLVHYRNHELPLQLLQLGSRSKHAPVLALFGGVHGIERIGTEVVLAYLHSLVASLCWSSLTHRLLERVSLVFMPVVNPVGMLRATRCNGNGVDLMRNSPVNATDKVRWPLGGQRLSRHFPWYRGDQLEPEARALCLAVERHLSGRPLALALDCHSGYGYRDRLWFPFAGSKSAPPHLAEIMALRALFLNTYPHHSYYDIEPQWLHYLTHGDLWDHLILQHQPQPGRLLSFTLEMGSWLWIRKNPVQLLRLSGLFNPQKPHRHQRILRRHLILFDFLARSVESHALWLPDRSQSERLLQEAQSLWFKQPA